MFLGLVSELPTDSILTHDSTDLVKINYYSI
ncbi:hypothetical protein [Yersinia phage vB_Yru_GN1]|uniref:Uncharacterized protein n=1 Tax=Yersinia phage vB_Yru_GN1 TaxID=3074381 RepID=A0AA86IWK7_9CAUD|nr:hypothetical protein [Yersinia phage vB_Yru_GN1]